MKASCNVSVTITFVALLGPLFLTIIMNLTVSPTLTFSPSGISAYLMIVMLDLGATVTLVSLDGTSVVFSVEFTCATFVNVPFVKSLTCTHTLVLVLFSRLSIVHVSLRLLSI